MIPLTSLSIKVPLQQDVPNKPKNGTDNLMKKLGKQTSQKSENFLNQNLEDPKEIDRETMEIDSLPKDQEKTRLVNLGLRNNQNEQEDVEMMDINEIRVKEQENSENVVEPRINGIVDRNIENLSQEMEDSPAAISNSYQSSGSQVVFTSNNRVHSLARKRSSNPESLVRDQAKMIRMNTTRLLNQTPDSSSPTLQIPSSDVSIPSTYMLTPKKFNNTPLPSPSSTIVSSASNVPRTPTPMDPWTSNTTSTSIASQQWHINTSHPSTSNLASSNMVADSMHVSRLSNLVTINRIPPIDSQIGDPVISQHGTRFYPAQPKVSSSRKPTFPAQTGRQNLQIPVINLDHQSTSRSIENISTVPRSGGACALQNGPRTRISPKKPRSHKQSDQAFIYMVHRSGYFTLERKYPLTKNMIPPRYIPCTDLDIPVPLKVPFDPINEFGLESLYEAFRMHVESVKMDFNQAVPVQHLFLADTLYFAFNHKIFENAHMIRIEAKALSKWLWTTKLAVSHLNTRMLNDFEFKSGSNIFYGLGLDFLLYYSGTLETTVELVKMELNLLLDFCSKRTYADGQQIQFQIVFITIPEYGDFKGLFKQFNDVLRKFIWAYKKQHDSFWCRLELLDWADHCLRAINLDKIKIENRFNILYILLQQYGVQFKK
uniref:NR LBD domain-containing protein n=1 Tax=Acrobeloides nanus TaxID=290746 RepID=A0A914CRJ8_9BILA